jgi:hypothetical protein
MMRISTRKIKSLYGDAGGAVFPLSQFDSDETLDF